MRVFAYLFLTVILAAAMPIHNRATSNPVPLSNSNPVCIGLETAFGASQAVQAWCRGPLGPAAFAYTGSPIAESFVSNIDAATPSEDSGKGTGNPSIAAAGPYVVAAWNDASGFFSPCPSLKHKEEFAGIAFSNNGGLSFSDEGGLPNSNCSRYRLFEPRVVSHVSGGVTYFYIASLILANSGAGENGIGLNTCKVVSSQLQCGNVTALGLNLCTNQSCDVLDEESPAIDAVRGKLYIAFTLFNRSFPHNSVIDVFDCDLVGHGGTPAAPMCFGINFIPVNTACENTGSHATVDNATGHVYVAYEYNWFTNKAVPSCASSPVSEVIAHFDSSLTFLNQTSFNITPLDNSTVPGYSERMNDFPQIAVSDVFSKVSIVWNDARFHSYGDILEWAFNPDLTATVTPKPIVVNTQRTGWHLQPGVSIDGDGDLAVIFHQRTNPSTTLTDVYGTFDLSPLATTTPLSNFKITTASSDWAAGTSNFNDKWGEYSTINHSGNSIFVTWSDGRLGQPQPFVSVRTAQ